MKKVTEFELKHPGKKITESELEIIKKLARLESELEKLKKPFYREGRLVYDFDRRVKVCVAPDVYAVGEALVGPFDENYGDITVFGAPCEIVHSESDEPAIFIAIEII